jgi:hypothetical protein
MIAQPKKYLGVSCARCGKPIPVSAKVVSIHDEIAQGEANVPHAFVARCPMCEYESVYEIGHVRRFDGEPPRRHRRRMARAKAA